MKTIWVCEWEMVPGDGVHVEKFSSYAEANRAMRQRVVTRIDLEEYLQALEPEQAAYLRRFFSDPDFPACRKEVFNCDADEESYCLDMDAYSIFWEHYEGACPELYTNMMPDFSEKQEGFFSFCYDEPRLAAGCGVRSADYKIYSVVDYGTSAYPLLILSVLGETPLNQETIISRVRDRYEMILDRKAVGRHLKMLTEMGFPVEHRQNGYCCGEKNGAVLPGGEYTPNAYPLLVLSVLDDAPKTQKGVLEAVEARYHVRMERKAVSRHLKLLEALDFASHHGTKGFSRKR